MAKKGLSRRMQKQGPPEPLKDATASRKRKDLDQRAEPPTKKKKQTNGTAKLPSEPATRGAKPLKSALKRPAELPSAKSRKEAQVSAQKKASLPEDGESSEDIANGDDFDGLSASDDISDDADGIDDPDILCDEHNDPTVDHLEDAAELASSSSDPFNSQDEDADPTSRKNGQIWSDDEDGEDGGTDLDAANIEGLSAHLDAKAASEAAAAQAELEEAALQTNIAGDAAGGIPDIDSDDDTAHLKPRLAPDLQLLRQRINDTIRILSDFSKHKKATSDTRARSEYTTQFQKDICAYYSYSPFLCSKLSDLFTPAEAFSFFESNETPRPLVLRTNTLKTHRRALAQALINRGVTLEPVGKWSKVGLQVFESSVPLGATPEYLAGHYILQAASSFLPVMALAPQEHERILDMASAPGGKTTHMAALMHNTGTIFANDPNKARAKALIGNIARMGVKNAIVSSCDALDFLKFMKGGLDRVLLDAPCSGTGVIAKDPSVKTGKTEHDFIRLPELQKKLLLAAIDLVDHTSKTGGYLVYSTCSVSVEENEAVVSYALRKRPNVKIVETGLTFGREGFVRHAKWRFEEGMRKCRRYYPHVYNVDGFFVCKLRKIGPSTGAASGGAVKGVNGAKNEPQATRGEEVTGEKEHVEGSTAESQPLEVDRPAKTVAEEESDFGGFSDEEGDRALIERARRRAMRRKGLDPRADRRKANTKST
ncbi:MAG: hypothetical protein Q9162_001277 [Coniocarpon cinnabarinum]